MQFKRPLKLRGKTVWRPRMVAAAPVTKPTEPVTEDADGVTAAPACEECQRELTWRDYAYCGAKTKVCKRCKAHSERVALAGDYVLTHKVQVNHDQRRMLGVRNGGKPKRMGMLRDGDGLPMVDHRRPWKHPPERKVG